LIDYILYVSYKLFKFIILLLPKTLVKLFLDGLSNLLYFFDKEHKKYAKANIDFVYGDKINEIEKNKIIKNSYRNLVYNLYEFIENQTLDLAGFESKTIVENDKYMLDALKNKRKIILITAHYGNWELGGSFISLKYNPTTIVGRLLNNKYLNDELLSVRNAYNSEMLSTNQASKGLIRALKKDRVIGLVIDQHNTLGIDVEFLGHKVKITDSTARLAVRFNAIILPVFFTMQEFGKYTAKFYEPIEPSTYEGENQILNLTQAQANIMEKHILQKPEQWFWQHKRFKQYNSEIYE